MQFFNFVLLLGLEVLLHFAAQEVHGLNRLERCPGGH